MIEMRRTKDLEDSVKKQSNELMTFRAFSIGVSAALLAFACGGDSNSSDDDATGGNDDPAIAEEVEPRTPVRETCADNQLLAGCEDENDEPDTVGQPAPGPDVDPRDEPGGTPADLARAAAENVLNSNCGQCHGTALPPGAESGNMNYINDIEQLVDNGKVQPLNSAGSRIIQRMKDGSMPPAAAGLPRVNENDINTVAQFIDNPQFWPDFADSAPSCQDQLFTFDDL